MPKKPTAISPRIPNLKSIDVAAFVEGASAPSSPVPAAEKTVEKAAPQTKKKYQLHAYIDGDLEIPLKQAALAQRKKISELVEDIIREHLAR